MTSELPGKSSSQRSRPAREAVVAPGWQSIADLPVGLAVFDRDVRYLAASRRWLEDNGLAGRNVVGELHYDLFPDLPDEWKAVHQRALAGETITAHEDCYERADGSRLWKNWECRPWYDASGIVGGIQMWGEDVTARMEAEAHLRKRLLDITAQEQAAQALREELASTTRVLENTGALAKVGGWEFDVRSARLHWSLETCRIHEIDPPVTPPLADAINFYAPEARPVIESLVNEAVQHGTPYDVELPLVTATGRPIWVRAQCAPEMEDGMVVVLRGAFHDITERKQAEREREESHNLLVNLSRLVPSAIYQYRLYPDGRSAFPYANHGINDIYEVTPDEVREEATPVFGRLHPEDAERVGQAIMESARTLEEFYCEFRVILPRQGLRWRWSQAHPERMADGGTLWHGIISDITERKLAEQEKATLEAQLAQAQKMESVGRLAGGVAHDFNNMLGVILGNVDLALGQIPSTNPAHAELEEIRGAAIRSADLTRQLLAFARQQPLAPQVLDLNHTVAGTLKMLQRLIGEDVGLRWRPAPDLWPVKLDPTQVDQILTNLCVNARDAISGTGHLTIETGHRVFSDAECAHRPEFIPGEYVMLGVSDDGVGMDAETRARVFEPFFTTKEIGKGTGLGLSTVYGIVRQSGGFIEVYSELAQGTSFRIYFPRCLDGEGTRTAEAAASTAMPRGDETILLAEDDPGLLAITAEILELQGYTVLRAATPHDAIRLAEERAHDIHLLMTDVIMPEMNGRDLATRLLARYPHMKHLFASGYTADVIFHRGMLDDGVHFIQKPFSQDAVSRKVREVLDG